MLYEYQAAVDRIDADVSKGIFQFPCKPAELASWALNNNVELAEAFLNGLPKNASVTATAKPSKRGRPSTAERDQKMLDAAHEFFDQAVLQERRIKKFEVAEKVGAKFGVGTERAGRIIGAASIDWSRGASIPKSQKDPRSKS